MDSKEVKLVNLKGDQPEYSLEGLMLKSKLQHFGHLLLTHDSLERDVETVETVSDFILGAPKSLQMVFAAMKLKDAYSLEEKLWPT